MIDQLLKPYYEFPSILLNGFQNNDNTITVTISECWNLCETNSIIKCTAISYNLYNSICYLYSSEFFERKNFGEEIGFTTLMRKSENHDF